MFILTNDDGIDAPGLAALAAALTALNEPFLTVAPLHPMSECSHRVTTKHPLIVTQRNETTFAVDGTPADCARIAALHILPLLQIPVSRDHTVLSGINAGGNLGHDVYISGTVAAVREAVILGLSGIAFSQYKKGNPEDPEWRFATAHAIRVLQRLRNRPPEDHAFYNVNFPWPTDAIPSADAPEIIEARRSRKALPIEYDRTDNHFTYLWNRYHGRAFETGSDIEAVFSGKIAITQEHV